MSEVKEQGSTAMPEMARLILTNRLPCALLAVAMLTAAYWFGLLFGNIPVLGFLMILVGLLLHVLVPSVFAIAVFGGGLGYSLQVGGIAALMLLLVSSGSIDATLIFAGFFVLLPVATAYTMQKMGLNQAVALLAILMFFLFVAALMVGMEKEGLEAFVMQLFKPVFDSMVANLPVGEVAAVDSLHQLQSWMVKIFPGMLVFSLWLAWLSSIVFARSIAKKYGFYQGDTSHILKLFLPKQWIYVLLFLFITTMFAVDDLHYIASNGLLVTLGLVAVQGVVVAHAWLKSRGMTNSIMMMYMMLFFWSAIVLVFVFVGLLDFWFNFRRNMVSTTGEK